MLSITTESTKPNKKTGNMHVEINILCWDAKFVLVEYS